MSNVYGESGCEKCVGFDAKPRWYGDWGVSAQAPFPAFISVTEMVGQTVRLPIVLRARGERVRLRFSNALGLEPLRIGAASIALSGSGGSIDIDSLAGITFGGESAVVVPPGASVTSDPACFEIDPPAELSVSLFFPIKTPITTAYFALDVENYLSMPGNHVGAEHLPVSTTINTFPFLVGVDVLSTMDTGVVVALGDSITSGHSPKVSWPALLADRLAASEGARFTVVNAGIAGNMLSSQIESPSIPDRFERDVLSVPGVTHIILLAGLNDIARPYTPDMNGIVWQEPLCPAEALTAIYRQLIARAHERGLKIYGGTLTPLAFGGPHFEERQRLHDEINAWIRESNVFDAVIDFNKAVVDPANPGRLIDAYDFGDHLHLNAAGFGAMADAIDLSLLR